ncbi:MAG: 6-carboxy-5,6,7,8-tetrahydropterin synthase [bacterium ADurb.Bin425]|uniref:6-carboxy-5,6,7,8-tetrahydropterin synthase n=1 Tax=Candidatus Obscuribacter phosphatis TaxID=1906157 RepID=A0A8J7PG64_9BACT|nr:6-carboxytetrahydropterin synthase [Candidatus Obscuribacter phosphatis]OPZ90608.1 MAG: 6-carboxy-5,6,7,8-tetrahydropterin synthase [bacterium ADurb.Bin425]
MELISRMQFNESEERLALSTVTASRRLQFCAGHRVYGHESKCANLHGHNYVVFLYARSENELNGDGLDSLGRVVDFGQLKSLFAPWIEDNWDHGFIVSRNDLEAQQALNMIPGQKLFVMDSNPTAENMARYILLELAPRLLKGSGVRLTKVVLWETENCFAEVELV